MKKLLIALICISLICTCFLTSCKKDKVVEEEKVEEKVEEIIPEVPEIDFEVDLDKKEYTAIITGYTGEDAEITVPAVIQAVIEVPLTEEEIAALEAQKAEAEKAENAKTDAKEEKKSSKKKTKAPTKHVIQDFNVIGIADGAFFANETIEAVTVEEGIETIGAAAFQNCKALKSIKLPESLTTIGVRAFYGCEVLSEMNIGANVNSIGYMAFSDIFFETPWYAGLTDTAVIVGDGILLKYNGTADAVFGDEVKHVAYYAFADNPVANVTFNGTLESVDSKAFFESKPTVHIPAGSASGELFTGTGVSVKAGE